MSAKDVVEDCRRLNIFGLKREGHLVGGTDLLGGSLVIGSVGQEQHIRLTSTPCYFGGRRWWFVCPACDRRAGVLYKPPHSRNYLCRHCHGLSYMLSQNHRVRLEPILRDTKLTLKLTQLTQDIGQKGPSKRKALQILKTENKLEQVFSHIR